jgi:hypothetical protein
MHEGEDFFEKFIGMEPYLYISKDDLDYIKETWTREEASEKLARVAMTYPLPLREMTYTSARQDYMKLKGVRWNELLVEGDWFPRKSENLQYPIDYQGKMMYIKRYTIGNRASDFFHQYNRWLVDGSQGPGPVTTWNNLKFMKTLMGPYFTLGLEEVNEKTLRTCLSLRKYTASQFKPSVAKAIYDFFKAENIIDFSMGWGDRLCGFYASDFGKLYVGLDPNSRNHPIYQSQIDFYEQNNGFFEHDRDTVMYDVPAEDFDYSSYENQIDLIFTSPPYFNVEKYSTDDTQSWIRYKKIDAWNKHFLHTALGKMIPTLKSGGIMAINISDVYSSSGGSREHLSIVNPMNDFLKSQGLEYMGAIGMEMSKRPNSGGAGMARETGMHNWSDDMKESAEENKNVVFAEPIWLWKKN